MKSKTPLLSLIGDGTGDPELITIKAIRAIEAARVVLYDALANIELLSYKMCSIKIVSLSFRVYENDLRKITKRFFFIIGCLHCSLSYVKPFQAKLV